MDQYSLQADVYNSLSTLTVTGATYNSSTNAYETNLQIGTNTITLEVTAQNGFPVVWSSNRSQIVQSSGSVTRPDPTEASVILTATIQHNGAQLSRTFLVIVKQQGLSIVSMEVTRNVPIRVGDSNTDVEQTPITRKVLSDGSKIVKIIAGSSQLSSALQSAINNNQSKVRVVASDIPNDPARK